MRTEQLEYLIEISKTHSISEASERLHLTRSALSLSIKSLENELGIQLLERAHRGSWLTEEGNKIVDGAQTFFNLIHSLQKTQQLETTSNFSGELSFYSCLWVSELVMPQIAVRLQKKHPNIYLNPEIIRSEVACQKMLDEPKEFALTDDSFFSNYPSTEMHKIFEFHSLFTMYPYCQVHPSFPIASSASISLKSLQQYPILIIHRNQEERSYFDDLLDCVDVPFQTLFVRNKAIYDEMLLSGLGIGLNYFPNATAATKSTISPLKIMPISDDASCQFGYLSHRNQQLSPINRYFLQFFTDYLTEIWHID